MPRTTANAPAAKAIDTTAKEMCTTLNPVENWCAGRMFLMKTTQTNTVHPANR